MSRFASVALYAVVGSYFAAVEAARDSRSPSDTVQHEHQEHKFAEEQAPLYVANATSSVATFEARSALGKLYAACHLEKFSIPDAARPIVQELGGPRALFGLPIAIAALAAFVGLIYRSINELSSLARTLSKVSEVADVSAFAVEAQKRLNAERVINLQDATETSESEASAHDRRDT
eukprot:CAMPEP_0169137648 /NCGR_PEP_ID=MMETSP1015-20121227/41669_1 /TAXON_ID=342587 /ORGANISM="Karlodinium micrum, Strain CCMP2283" /LENGTH=176 /DNA_ID=CAMNT_0009202543 /DNA_START=65 /DNA_END=595 /DNA_ORIENTATION=-